MLIASKMEEAYPLKIKTVFEKIGHKKLPMQELLSTEEKILSSLDYKLNFWSFYDVITMKFAEYSNKATNYRPVLG